MGKKDLYIITIELDEDSIYFVEMTHDQARKMEKQLSKVGHPFSVAKIRKSPGFNSFNVLMKDFASA